MWRREGGNSKVCPAHGIRIAIQLEENTAESIADNAKFDYLVAFCTHHENGEKVYKNIDDYNLKSSDSISFMAAAKLAEMIKDWEASQYAYDRQTAYPDIGDQLDDLYKEGVFSASMAAKLKKVKDDNPKG